MDALDAHEARLYLLPEEEIDDAARDLFAGWLTEEERRKWRRFYFEADQKRYLLTRALVRSLLAQYLSLAPQSIIFAENQYGRPFLEDPSHQWLHFNLSHTKGMIVCLIACGREVGVDVESTERRSDGIIQIADRFFSSREVEALRALPASAQRTRFFTYWTLKESYIKARGMGLSIPLELFSFLLEPISVEVDPLLEDHSSWSFTLRRAREAFLVATALETFGDEPVILEHWVTTASLIDSVSHLVTQHGESC